MLFCGAWLTLPLHICLLVLCIAMMRRAVANKGLTRYVQAKQDLETVLEKEPNNKQALVSIFTVTRCFFAVYLAKIVAIIIIIH